MRVLENWDVTSLYPSLVELYNYSSRNQPDSSAYIDLLHKRKKAKKELLPDEFLKEFNVTNGELKVGLKLPLNAYTGTLRAIFNKLYDPLQGFSICTTGQLFILQLIYDLQHIPTLEMVSANTDAVMYTVDEEYKEQAHSVLHQWEKQTGLELEEDKIVKIYMRDVNNYCELVQTGDNDYEVHYKGGCFNGNHKFKWDKEKHKFNYSFEDGLETNSVTIVAEALLKYLLFEKPIENTINNCNDVFRFQIISHLGSTYEKCVQESPNGDILLQRNNRIYAGKKPSGKIIKVKYDGRRDSLASQPTNPIIDNKNVISIEDIDKAWYIKLANQWANDFKGVRRLTKYKKNELLELALKKGLSVDKKIKKVDLIKLIEESEENNMSVKEVEKDKDISSMNIYQKIAEITKEIRQHDFVLDCVNPGNLGGKEYASIGQYYNLLHNLCNKYNLLFKWDVVDLKYFEKDVFKPTGKMPSNVAVVSCFATFYTIDGGDKITYNAMAGGSDIADKSVSGASTLAFRNWFDKNFTPKYMNTIDEEISSEEVKTEEPKIPTYLPPEKKEQLVEKVVNEKQVDNDEEYKQSIVTKIMDVRSKLGNNSWGENTVNSILTEELSSADLLSIELKVNNKLDSLK